MFPFQMQNYVIFYFFLATLCLKINELHNRNKSKHTFIRNRTLKKKTITIYCSLTLPERGTGEEDYSSSSKKSSSILTWRKSDSGVTYYVCFFPYSLVDFGIPFRGNVSFFSSHCHLKDQYSINLF